MREKKQNKHTDSDVRKSHDPTAFELAFQKATAEEALQKQNVGEFKSTSRLPNAAKELVLQAQSVHQQEPKFKSACSIPELPKRKRVYIPPKKSETTNKGISKTARKRTKYTIKNNAENNPEKKTVEPCFKPVNHEAQTLHAGVLNGGVSKKPPAEIYNTVQVARKSQVHGGKPTRESDIVIGFDFGTSSSKLVIRDSGRQTAYAVPFGSLACPGNTYLVPTRIYLSNDGNLSLSTGEFCYTDLKIHLMENPERPVFEAMQISQPVTSSELAAGYMALVIRHARAWFLNHSQSIYTSTHIHWHINLGIPSKNYDDSAKRKTFQTTAMAAWRISMLDAATNILEVKKYLQEANNYAAIKESNLDQKYSESLWLHTDFVNAHPEVIMEVVGYVRSPLRTNGLHLLVDVGATTVDAATFVIHSRDGEDIYPLLETKVEKYGTMILHKRRIQAIKLSLEKSLREKNSIDPVKALPASADYAITAGENDIYESDKAFFQKFSVMVGEIVRDTRNARDPYSAAWGKGLPVFICGGGGRLPSYKNIIRERGLKIASGNADCNVFNIKEIPKPDQLYAPDLPYQEYDRLAVAYGLGFTSLEIGEVIPESKVSDIQRVERTRDIDIEDLYVSKDMC